jgi:riboflavin synthase
MFTGLITHIGTIKQIRQTAGGLAIATECPDGFLDDATIGESIAVSGPCLTVTSVEHGTRTFTADVSAETLERTTIGKWRIGRRVNLERSLKAGERLGGHFVMGHIDGVARLVSSGRSGDGLVMTFDCDSEISRLVAVKGSVAMDGVSLTPSEKKGNSFAVSVIPHTLDATTLGQLSIGDEVNMEADIIARYILNLLESIHPGSSKKPFGYDIDKLRNEGF